MLALLICNTVYVLDVTTNREDTLPSCDGVRTNNRVDCLQLRTDVLGSTSLSVIETKATLLSDLFEVYLLEGYSETLKELLVWLANAIINLIARCP